MAPSKLESGKPQRREISIDDLQLDPQNPRLVVGEVVKQIDLLAALYELEGLDELVPSLQTNGYFQEEPLVVVPESKGYVVVEGNRRLATIKLLLDHSLRKQVGVEGWPTLSSIERDRLRVIPCVVHERRSDVFAYLGYRHITGAKRWAPFQKARFIAQLIEGGWDLDAIETVIGDSSRTTKKLYQDFVVFQQIVGELGADPKPIRERFSLLEVTLGQASIKAHLGLPSRLPSGQVDSLVPEDRLDQLREITTWVFGNDELAPVITDSRDINRALARVIENAEALDYLRETRDLQGAYERSDGEEQFLLRTISSAERSVQNIATMLPLYLENESVVKAITRLAKQVDGLKRQVDR